MTRTSYPIPPGYRMLKPGEIIQITDLYWSERSGKFISVAPMDYHGQLADPAKHPCLLRTITACQNCGSDMNGLHNWAGDTQDAYACSRACLDALERKWKSEVVDPDQFCYGCGVRLPDSKPDLHVSHNGTKVYFHSQPCKDEWWHRSDRAKPKTLCEGCGRDMTSMPNYGAGLHRADNEPQGIMACSQHCFESCQFLDVPVSDLMTPEERAANREAIDDLSGDIRPTYYHTDNVYEPFKIIRYYNLNFFEGNVLKYLLRAGKKDAATHLQDLIKARTYLNSEIRKLEQDSTHE